MKKVIVLFVVVFIVLTTNYQVYSNIPEGSDFDSPLNDVVSEQSDDMVTFRLFPTQNMWTFIKLNTRNGKIWQVQYDVQGDNRFETYINLFSLVSKEERNGRFTLYPTQNLYTFILLDRLDGRMWQVQWAIKPENRGIVPIK